LRWLSARSEVINKKTLDELASSVEGGDEMVRKVKAVYLTQLPNHLDHIREMALSGKVRDCQKVAHSLKTSSYTLGLERTGDAASAIESWRADGSVALLDLIDRLATEASAAASALKGA
jgi:HPt (histidine-containing phosphotransfer) domain-containing protein